MKRMNLIIIITFVLIILIFGFSLVYNRLTLYNQNTYESLCKLGIIRAQIEMINEIKELKDYQMLCSNSNCSSHFQKQIDEREYLINSVYQRIDCKSFYKIYKGDLAK